MNSEATARRRASSSARAKQPSARSGHPSSRIHFDELLGTASVDKRLAVLRSIHSSGSISEAARSNGVSYKAAWQALETLSNLAGVPLVLKVVGGAGGGGARLTPDGLKVLEVAERLHLVREQALEQILRGQLETALDLRGLVGMGWRTSMRNQIPCTVRRIARSRGAVRVTLELVDGQWLDSRITLESLQLLDLQPGQSVLAMFKATAVIVAPTIVAQGGVNLLRGQVIRRGAGTLGVEVSLQLAPNVFMVGFAEPEARLRTGQAVMAALDDHAVVIALLR